MMTRHRLVAAWLQQVEGLANHLPPAERAELLAELRDHLERPLPDDPTDAKYCSGSVTQPTSSVSHSTMARPRHGSPIRRDLTV